MLDPEVNLTNSLHRQAITSYPNYGIRHGFETQGRRHQKPKQGLLQWPHKDLSPPENMVTEEGRIDFICPPPPSPHIDLTLLLQPIAAVEINIGAKTFSPQPWGIT